MPSVPLTGAETSRDSGKIPVGERAIIQATGLLKTYDTCGVPNFIRIWRDRPAN
jgi:hypothetical protein